jgi:hypothetical protein
MQTSDQVISALRKELSNACDRLGFLKKELNQSSDPEEKAELCVDIISLNDRIDDLEVDLALEQREVDCEGILE